MRERYDLIVVGAGPAGSVAARLAAERGLSVLLLEKRQEIGAPVRCAEAVGQEVTRPYLEPDSRWVDARISTFSVTSPAGATVRVPPTEPTLVVNRKVFDLELARRAAAAGAEVLAASRAMGLLWHDGAVAGVRVSRGGRSDDVAARLVIAADGIESQVARWAGLPTVPPLADYFVGCQYLLGGIGGRFDPAVCEYHLGQELAPNGYAWLFPKGSGEANVGLVVAGSRAGRRPGDAGPNARALLDEFVSRRCPGASILGVVAGGVAVTGALRRMVTGGLMAVGDAAHQSDPLTGGGINLGMMGADLAVQVAVAALAEDDVSHGRLQEYEALWRGRFGRMHAALHGVRQFLLRLSDANLDALVGGAAQLPLAEMDLGQIVLALCRDQPQLLLHARALISTGLILK
jgi:digeranylgeranylglycerophospholipid reductase